LGQRDNLMSVRFLPGFQPASDPATGSGPSQSWNYSSPCFLRSEVYLHSRLS
jgi:hypothetical protein